MGMFDYVKTDHPAFVCSEGHVLTEFQTKSFESTLGDVIIGADGTVTYGDGPCGSPWPSAKPYLGRANVYTDCCDCPCFVAAGTFNICPVWVEFDVEIVDNRVRSIERVSPATPDFIRQEAGKPYMQGAIGPMSVAEAGRYSMEKRSAR